MFVISFYIFSAFLSFTDYKKFLVPNNMIISMTVMMLVFGILESKLYMSSILLSITVLLFFIALMLIDRKMILGGGDIKYMILVALFLGLQPFALFLVFTGIFQTIALLYVKKIRKRRIAPMVPLMFLSTIIVNILVYKDIYPFKF